MESTSIGMRTIFHFVSHCQFVGPVSFNQQIKLHHTSRLVTRLVEANFITQNHGQIFLYNKLNVNYLCMSLNSLNAYRVIP